VGSDNGFPLDLPDFGNLASIKAWQQRVVERLDFTINQGTTTGNNTATALAKIALQPLTVYGIESWVLGVLNSTTGSLAPGQAQLTVFRGGFKLNASNAATAIGSGASKIYAGANLGETAEPWATALTVSDNTVVQQVTGTTDDLIHWRCAIKIFEVSI
jgi:hypothetical protein